jgi:CRISPR-associated endonuclease/helicase Cas3
VGLQTEGDAFDPFLRSDAVLTTPDELLSMTLHRPLGLHPGLCNINAGALLGAYLVFDEFPALASREMLLAWIGLLRTYLPTAPSLFMTATWPRALCSRVAELLDAEFIDASDCDGGGQRTWEMASAIPPETILRRHERRTLVLCNTVRGAQMLYRALRQQMTHGFARTELFILHQHQFHRDRDAIAQRVIATFAEARADAIFITTPGLEVAADVSAELLITDPAPPDALLRRAGRCARRPGETGQVLVGRVSEFVPEDSYPAPSAGALCGRLADGTPKTFPEELAALDDVWDTANPGECPAALATLPAGAEADAAIQSLMTEQDAFPPTLFSRVGACLHRMPETIADPFELERFSLALSSLERGWRHWRANGSPAEWFALVPHWPAGPDRPPTWSVVEDPAEFRASLRLVVLNAEAVSYHPVLGLELSPGSPYESARLPEQHTAWSPFDQHVESYADHAAGVLAAVERALPWYRFVLRRLGRRWRMPLVEMEQWLRLTVLWHDAGKLTAEWQRCAARWQAEVVRRPARARVLARIDYQTRRDGAYPCTDHANDSGYALIRAVSVLLEHRPALQQGTLAAIMHHHGVITPRPPELTPHPEAWSTLLEVAAGVVDDRLLRRIDRMGWTGSLRGNPQVPQGTPADPDGWMAYSLLSRAIRLADRDIALGADAR